MVYTESSSLGQRRAHWNLEPSNCVQSYINAEIHIVSPKIWSFSCRQPLKEVHYAEWGRTIGLGWCEVYFKEQTSLNGVRNHRHELARGAGRRGGALSKLPPSLMGLESTQHIQ